MTETTRAPNRPIAYGEALANRDANSNRNPRFALWSLAGRQVLLCAVADPSTPEARAAIAALDTPQTSETMRVSALFTAAPIDAHPQLPEFGQRTYRAPTGGAVIFSCALMHEVTPMTRGQRYAFLPFLYDEAAAKTRLENNGFLDNETIKPYGGP